MPNNKKTKHTNKKRNKKLQQEKEGKPLDVIPEGLSNVLNFIDGAENNYKNNTLYAKKLSYEIFGKYKNNMIYGKKSDKKTTRIIGNLIKNNKLTFDDYGFLENDGIMYAINIPLYNEWDTLIKKITGFSKGAGERIEKENLEFIDVYTQFLFNPPKTNGEVMNFNVGLMGSIWIDTHNKFRIAIYNGASKEYNIKDFKPNMCIFDNSKNDCKFKTERIISAEKIEGGVKVNSTEIEDTIPHIKGIYGEDGKLEVMVNMSELEEEK